MGSEELVILAKYVSSHSNFYKVFSESDEVFTISIQVVLRRIGLVNYQKDS